MAVIAAETAWAITLRGGSEEGHATARRKNVPRSAPSPVSLISDGLQDNLGEQGLADAIPDSRADCDAAAILPALLFSKQNFDRKLKDTRVPIGAG